MEVDTDDEKKTLNVDTTAVNMENAEEPINNDAKICSPEMVDVLPMFANMLDAKSFMKLALTCKGMYKGCMENKAIKINVDERYISANCSDGRVGFSMISSFVSDRNLGSYVSSLRKQRFSLNVNTVRIDGTYKADIPPTVNAAHNFLKDIGVKMIKMIAIHTDSSNWNDITTLIKECGVKKLFVRNSTIPPEILRSLLQMDLDEIDYDGWVPVDTLLEIDSPIRTVILKGLRNIRWDKFMQILWKIQTGTLKHLTVRRKAVIWLNGRIIKFDYDDELPEHRPLVFQRRIPFIHGEERFILHWQGGVTKCVIDYDNATVDISLCPSNEFPPILRKEEDVLKDLTEMVPRVSCFKRQFDAFLERFTLIEQLYEGPLPPDRPLYFKIGNGFLKLAEDDDLMKCVWENGLATWKPFDFVFTDCSLKAVKVWPIGYRSLSKLMFINRLQKSISSLFYLNCGSVEKFDFWLEDYKKVDFEHSGPLPKERPLLFEKRFDSEDRKFCAILFEDRLLQCRYFYGRISVERCELCNRPPILIDAKHVMKILQKPFYLKQNAIRMDHETFLNGFELFKTFLSSRYSRPPLVFEKTENIDRELVEERWFISALGLSKIGWQDGCATITPAPHEVPLEFTKELFKKCAEAVYFCMQLPMDLKQFESCLESFEKHPFEYCGPLAKDRVLAFVKKDIHHTCNDQPAHCGCSEVICRVWFLSDGVKISYCIWKANKADFTVCEKALPHILKSRRYLKNLLGIRQLKRECWYGNLADFVAYFDGYTRILLSHKGPLPEERPLVVERDAGDNCIRYLLRDDGKIIECKWRDDICGAILETVHPFADRIPTVLMSLFVTCEA